MTPHLLIIDGKTANLIDHSNIIRTLSKGTIMSVAFLIMTNFQALDNVSNRTLRSQAHRSLYENVLGRRHRTVHLQLRGQGAIGHMAAQGVYLLTDLLLVISSNKANALEDQVCHLLEGKSSMSHQPLG